MPDKQGWKSEIENGTWGEAGTVKMKLIGTPKVVDRGTAMMFVGYTTTHDGDTYRMYNPTTRCLGTTRDIIWLRRMYYPSHKILS